MPPKTHPSIDIEKEEAVCMQMYNRALSQMSQAKLDSSLLSRARDTFEELLRSPLLTNNANEKFSKASKMFKYLAYKNLVSVHTQEGNYAGALECAKKALETDSSDGVLYFRAGALALKQKDYPMAAFLLRKCLEIIPMHWDALNTLLGVLFVLDEFDECNTIADKCLFYNPDNKRAFVLKSYLNSEASHILPGIKKSDKAVRWLEKLIATKENYTKSSKCSDKIMETEDNDCEMIEIKKVHIKELSWCALATAFAQNLEKLKTFSLEDIIEFVISPAALAGLKSEPKLTESDSAESQDTTSGACSQKEGCEASEQKKEVWEEKKVTRSRSNAKAPPEAQAILMRYDIVTKDLIASQTAKAQEQQSQQNSLKSLSAQHLQVPEMREVHDFVVRENKKHAVVEIIQLFFENYFMLSKNNSWDGTAVKHLITLHNILTKFSCGIIDKYYLNFAEFIIDQLKDKRIDFSKQDPPEFVKASQLLTHYITEFGKECDEAASARTFWLKSRMASLYDDLYAASRETKKALLLLECMEDKDKDKTHVEIPLPHCKNTVCVLSKESIKAYQTREELQSSFQDMSNVNEEIAKLAISKYSYVLTSNDGSDPQRLKKLEMLRKAYSFLKDSIGCVKCLIEELAEHEHSPKGYLVKASSILEDIKAQISGVEKGTLDLQLEETLLFTLYKILGKCGTENVPKQKSVQDIRVTSWELVIMLIDITPLGSSMSLSTRIDFFSDLHNYLKENNLCGSSTWIIIRFIKTLTEFPAPKNCISCKEWDDWEKRVIIPVTGKGFKEWIKMFGCCMYWITGKVLLDQHDLNVHKADKVDKEKQKMLQEPWLLARFFFVTSFLMDENTQMKNALIDSKDLLIKTFGSDNYPYKAYVDEVLGAGGKPGPDLLTKTKSLLTKAKKASVDIENYADNRFEAFARKYVYAAFVDMGNVKDSKVLCDLLLHALYINPVNVEYWELLGKCYQDELSNAIKVKTKPNKKEADLLFRNTMACLSNLIMGLRKAEVEAAEAEEEEEFFGNFFSLGIISYWMEKFEDASKSRYENSKGAFILCTRLKPNEWEPFLMIGRCEEKKDFDISVVLPIYHRALDLAIAADPDHSLCDECLYRVYATRVKYVMKGGDITVLNSVEKTNFTSCEDVLTDALKNGFEPILSSECSHYRALKMACKIWLHGPPLLQSPEKAERALSSNIRLLKNPPFQNLIKTGKDSLSNYMVMPWDHASYKEKILLFYVEALSRCESLDTLNNLFNSPICEDYPDVFKSAKAEMFKVISGEIDQSLLSTTTASSSQLVDADDASDHSKNLLKYTYNLVVKDSSYKELLTKAYRNYSLTTYKKEPDQETTPGDIIKICEGLGFKKRSSSYCHVNSKSKKSKIG